MDSLESIPGPSLKVYKFGLTTVLEFQNNVWGLGTESELRCHTGPPAYVAWRAGTTTLFLLGF